MKKQGLPLLLLFIMLITPVASAFEYCVGMDLSGHLSKVQNSIALPADGAISLDHKGMVKGSQSQLTPMDCGTNDSCPMNACGTYTITSSVPVYNSVTSAYYSVFDCSSRYSTNFSPDLRPPIIIL